VTVSSSVTKMGGVQDFFKEIKKTG